MRPPEDPPFYPAIWLIGFALLVYGWIEWGAWPAVAAFLGLLAAQALIVEVWLAVSPRARN